MYERMVAIINCKGLKEAYNLALTYYGSKDVEDALYKATYGVKTKWHIMYYLDGRYLSAYGYVYLDDKEGTRLDYVTEWWEEIEARSAVLKQAMMKVEEEGEETIKER